MNDLTRRESLGLLGAGLAALFATPRGGHAQATEPSTLPTTRPIPSSGASLPVIGLGTWQTFDVEDDERGPVEAVLAEFARLGGKVIDSSPMYGRSESVAGALIARLGLRDQLFVATKVWIRGKQQGVEQMEESMRRLRADPIDLMQVHNLLDVDTHLATLAEWKAAGRVKHVGVTHYTEGGHGPVIEVMQARPLDFVQINYSVAEREAEERLLPLAQEKGIAVLINRPFAGGATLRRLKDRPLPGFAGELGCASWAQLLLKFVVSHPAVTCAIPATSKVEHLRDNMLAGSGPMPDERQRKAIAEAAA